MSGFPEPRAEHGQHNRHRRRDHDRRHGHGFPEGFEPSLAAVSDSGAKGVLGAFTSGMKTAYLTMSGLVFARRGRCRCSRVVGAGRGKRKTVTEWQRLRSEN